MEGFTFAGTNSVNLGLRLINRFATSLTEKFITEDIPHMHGEWDFSTAISNERTFENRRIHFDFLYLNRDYNERKAMEHRLTGWLMTEEIQPLYDTHLTNQHWLGKFIGLDIEDDNAGALRISAIFWAYPLPINNSPFTTDTTDIWDTYPFVEEFQPVTFNVEGQNDHVVWNKGNHVLTPTIILSAPMTIMRGNHAQTLLAGQHRLSTMRLAIGRNPFRFFGEGTVTFVNHREGFNV